MLLKEAWARYTLREPVESLQARAEGTPMKRDLGTWQLTALGVGAIVGAGVFTVTGLVASQHTGPGVVVSLALVALLSALVAMAYAELASMLPLGGSAYTYASAGLGELVGWLVAWSLILSYAIGNGAIASSFSDNLTALLAGAGLVVPDSLSAAPSQGGLADLPALLVVLLVTAVLLRPVKESATLNSILVVVKVGVLLLFVAVGAFRVDATNLSPFVTGGLPGILAGAGLIFFAFLGFDALSTAAEEARNPQKTLPRGILVSLVVVTALYAAVALVLTGLVPSADLATGEPLAYAMRAVGLGWMASLLNVAGILATLSVFLVFQLATTRVVLAISRDGLMPVGLARLSASHGTPNRITLALGLLVGVSAAVLPLDFLVGLTSEANLFFFALVCVALVALRRLAPHVPRPFKCPASPWIPLLGAAACLGLMLTFEAAVHLGFLMWMGLGLILYSLYGARHSVLRRRQAALSVSVASADVPLEARR